MNETEYFLICDRCGNKKFYKNYNSFHANKNKNSMCKNCKNILHGDKLRGRSREFTQEWKDNLKKSLQNSKAWHDSMHSDEYKEFHRWDKSGKNNSRFGIKHTDEVIDKLKNISDDERRRRREHRLNQIRKSGSFPSYNEKACDYFNFLNNRFNLNGKHALNEGEEVLCGYSVDFYDSKRNIVIEWDEEHHYKQSNRKKDLDRQRRIVNDTKCDFYRIRQKTGEVTVVNGELNFGKELEKLWKKREELLTC